MTLHFDTNLLIDIVTAGSPQHARIRRWLADGRKFAASAVAWSEFCNGPHSKEQKDAVDAVIERHVLDFTREQAERAARLFHYTGRRRGSHSDCMIAACAIVHNAEIATRNAGDFQRFVPYGLRLLAVPS